MPHGVVRSDEVRKAGSGAIFRIEGETFKDKSKKKKVASFYLRCRLA